MFHGSMVALVTPMLETGELDWDALAGLVELHIQQGTDAIVAVGTSGESATLDEAEHCQVIAKTVAFANGRIPVIAGTGANSTQEAISLTRSAMAVGADACLLVTPYYNKPTQEGLYLHYKAIAEAVPIPQILYNVPSRTAVDMVPKTIERISHIPNIIGIKEATGDIERVREITRLCGERLDLYSGDDVTALDFILAGGKGGISVTANVAPRAVRDMYNAALAGQVETARTIDRYLSALHRHLFIEGNPIPVKWALFELGFIKAGIRLPLTPLSAEFHAQVRLALEQAGPHVLTRRQ